MYRAQTRLRRIRSLGARYVRIAFGVALTAACGTSTPVQPSSNAPNGAFAGTWVPTILIDSCTGSHYCIALDTTWSVLRLAPDGPGIHGSGYFLGTPFDVNGSVDATGELVITTPSTPGFSLDELRLRAGSTGLTGKVRFQAPPITIEGRITSAKRGPLESTQSNAEGTWNGTALTRVCTFTGWTDCPYLTRIFQLTLTQSSPTASGSLVMSADERYRLPVDGRFIASTLTLTGSASRVSFGATIQLRLIAWTGHTDGFGRMSGTLTLDEDFVAATQRGSLHIEADMERVYLLPGWFHPAEFAASLQPAPSQTSAPWHRSLLARMALRPWDPDF